MADSVTQAAPTTPRVRVAAGAAWLDEHHPGWESRVDLDRLVMQHACRCVLGQILGSYYLAVITLDQSVDMGFDAHGDGLAAIDVDFAGLTTEWTRLIEDRHTKAVPAG